MNITVSVASTSLPGLIDRAASALVNARSSAEVLEARDMAGVAYDAAKKAARLSKAKGAHDALIAAAHRAQADALEIEAKAKRRLADEYDAAQERGEAKRQGRPARVAMEKRSEDATFFKPGDGKLAAEALAENFGLIEPASLDEMRLDKHAIQEAREIRDAEKADPGIVRRTLDEAIESGEEPTRAKVKRAVKAKSKRRRGPRFEPPQESQHDRDLRMLLGVWEAACQSARDEFLETVIQ